MFFNGFFFWLFSKVWFQPFSIWRSISECSNPPFPFVFSPFATSFSFFFTTLSYFHIFSNTFCRTLQHVVPLMYVHYSDGCIVFWLSILNFIYWLFVACAFTLSGIVYIYIYIYIYFVDKLSFDVIVFLMFDLFFKGQLNT